MSSRPCIPTKLKVCVICEGKEEIRYFDRLSQLNVWSGKYQFVFKNAKSASKIFPMFQNEYQNDSHAAILIFCDTDKFPYKEFELLKLKMNNMFNSRTSVINKTIIFANPCTMQIILSHFGDVALTTQAKKTNGQHIKRLTGVENYDAHEEQIKTICSKITQSNYYEMKKRVETINHDYKTTPSTNIIEFLTHFENDDIKWIDSLNKSLNGKS